MTIVLSPDFVARAPTRDDAQEITDMIVASDISLLGAADFDLDSLLADWDTSTFDLTQDAHVVLTRQGKIVGYETVFRVQDNGRILTDGYVHLDYSDQGIGTYLVDWAESRGRQHFHRFPDDLRVFMQAGTISHDQKAHDLFESLGYFVVRHFWRMEIDLTEEPASPELPDGITIRTFVIGQDERATWQATMEAFEDHWGHALTPFDEWLAFKTRSDFDPSLWFLAMAGDQIAGVSICNLRMGKGWVGTLGVRRPWRQAGLGMALLRHSFGEFYRRGKLNIGLGVDAQSLTGATRLYERAGMHVAQRFDTFEKELRAGRSG